MSQLRSSPSETFSSGVFQLPPEILVYIAKYFLAAESKTKYEFTAFHRPNYRALIPLSMSHSYWRNICVTAGLFSFIRPRYDPDMTIAHGSPEVFGDRFRLSFGRLLLTRIMIDLSAPDLWYYCSSIIAESPSLKELGFTSSMRGSFEFFEKSSLIKRFAEFRGTSLVLRDARLDKSSLQLLLALRNTNITSLSLERSSLQMKEGEIGEVGTPLLPGLRKMRFLGAPFRPSVIDLVAILDQIELAKLFLVGAEITHFEIAYGVKPRLSDEPRLLETEIDMAENVLFLVLRRELLHALRYSSNESLRVFVELDEISGPFFGDDLLFYWSPQPPPPPFKALELLVFRCQDVESITRFDGIDNCLVGVDVWADRTSDPRNDHSAWIYMSTLYTFFSSCESIYIETADGGSSISSNWYTFSSQRLRYILDSNAAVSSWQYLIVGNPLHGYSGFQKSNTSTSINGFGTCSDSINLREEECKDLVLKGW